MKKLFISQPMRNKTDEEILNERENAIEKIKEYLEGDIEVINSFFCNTPPSVKPLWLLGKSLELLSSADIVYFVSGWEKARGCTIEHECATLYGIEILTDEDICESCKIHF